MANFVIKRFSNFKLIYYSLVIIFLLLLIPIIITHYYLNSINSSPNFDSINNNIDKSQQNVNLNVIKDNNNIKIEDKNDILIDIDSSDLCQRVKELLAIRSSVRNELRQLESKRRLILEEITEFNNKLDLLKSQLNKKSTELERIHISLEQTKYAQKEVLMKSNALLVPPLQLLPQLPQMNGLNNGQKFTQNNDNYRICQMHNCFDYSRCSLFSPFLIYFYHPEDDDIDDTLDIDNEESHNPSANNEFHGMRSQILDAFNGNVHLTFDPTIACIYVVILFNYHQSRITKSYLDNHLHSLPYWAGDGRNHLIINLLRDTDLQTIGVDIKKAMLVQTNFNLNQFRNKYDIIIPQVNINSDLNNNLKHQSIPLCPARRKYLATFLGAIDVNNDVLNQIKLSLIKLSTQVNNNNELLFDFVCDDKTRRLCNNQTLVLKQSTFALILPPNNSEIIFNKDLSLSLINIMTFGAIPVLIGGDYLQLPFGEVIDWRRAVIHLPIARVTELGFLLRSYSDADLIELRQNGQLLLNRHFISINAIISTVLALIRQSRLQIPSPAARNEQSQSVFNSSYAMKLFDSTSGLVMIDLNGDNDENLGPIEPPFSSVTYQRNYSLVTSYGYSLWNDHRFDPFTTYPSLPFDPILSSDAKFIGSSYGFRPIGGGAGGSGKEFSEALGGNVAKEQFTVVMLTYEREAVLIDSLQRLKGLPHLNKVLVIWNSPGRLPSSDLRWPDIGAPIIVVRSKKNSLNNRFLPYDEIETDAILSMDDDAHLRHDEIVFGFRVWREARDRIVGFPGRFHAWDSKYSSWLYNSNYSCELSMVLTGAAFFHKYYSYLYTYSMPREIRDKVDEYMNCEDIAMNFLVSHITRQPPIKVTSRWTFRCPGCPVSLSEDDSHFHERHKCINYFVSIYGYMPLLNTQFRADSVLFKTRIPHDKQKCFKFI